MPFSEHALDNAKTHRQEDEFNRWPFCERLADTIASFDASKGSPVFGLFGKWGYGKSTALNFVATALRDHHKTTNVFKFNPWLLTDTQALLLEFFSGLAKAISLDATSKSAEIAKRLVKYGGAIASGSISLIPHYGSLAAPAAKILETFLNEVSKDTIQAKRDRIISQMAQIGHTTVVMIDDLDRLEPDELLMMLKMVRLAANFPNIIYILAIDEDHVAQVASKTFGDPADGRRFLEKIIQYPFSLPAVSPERIARFVLKTAKEASGESGSEIDQEKWDKLHHIFRDHLPVQLSTPRQAIRYSNGIRFAVPMLKGEVDPSIQMLIEALRILFPDAYEVVRLRTFEFAELENEITGRNAHVSPADQKAALSLISTIKSWPTDKSPMEPRYYERYLSLAVAADDISDAELAHLQWMCDQNNQEAFDKEVRVLADQRLSALIERAGEDVNPPHPYQYERFLVAFAQIGEQFPKNIPLEEQDDARLLAKLLARWSFKEISAQSLGGRFLPAIAVEAARPVSLAHLIYRYLNDIRREDPEIGLTKNEEWASGFETLDEILLNKTREAMFNRSPFKEFNRVTAKLLIKFWQIREPVEFKEWLEKLLGLSPSDIGSFLALCGRQEYYYLNRPAWYGDILTFADEAVLARAAAAFVKSEPDSEFRQFADTFLEIQRARIRQGIVSEQNDK